MSNSFQKRKQELNEFKDDLRRINLIKTEDYFKESNIPDDIFHLCTNCKSNILTESLKSSNFVCPTCGYHHKLRAGKRIKLICDSFEEINGDFITSNNLNFPGYRDKIVSSIEKTRLKEAVITGIGKIKNISCAIAVMESEFIMGSMGSVVGEKITQLIEVATAKELPLLIFSASGGARMQEGIISLMQMAKTSAAIKKYKEKGLYISVLTNPTTGGVSASFAYLGDITISEPKSLIGFAGKRVIENTIKESLPDSFQTAEFQLEHGFLDMIVERKELKDTIYNILKLHNYK